MHTYTISFGDNAYLHVWVCKCGCAHVYVSYSMCEAEHIIYGVKSSWASCHLCKHTFHTRGRGRRGWCLCLHWWCYELESSSPRLEPDAGRTGEGLSPLGAYSAALLDSLPHRPHLGPEENHGTTAGITKDQRSSCYSFISWGNFWKRNPWLECWWHWLETKDTWNQTLRFNLDSHQHHSHYKLTTVIIENMFFQIGMSIYSCFMCCGKKETQPAGAEPPIRHLVM